MIISASRRTDIPAFYARWFMNRIRAGYCTVPNPFNPRQVSRVSLATGDVEAVVFWSRNPHPMIPFLDELDTCGYRYIFYFTILNNPRLLDANTPAIENSVRTFRELSDRLGPSRVIWRYDPIVLSNVTDLQFHRRNFASIARSLRGYTNRCIISPVHIYRKSLQRLRALTEQGLAIDGEDASKIAVLLPFLADTAGQTEMELFSCAQATDFSDCRIKAGKCIDADYLSEVFRVDMKIEKDRYQRKYCGCDVSKDIGMYDSCLFDCRYCYATSSHERARKNYLQHDAHSPSLLGCAC